MRPAGAERCQDMLQPRIGLRLANDLLADGGQLLIVEAAPQQFELHLQAARVADPLDWRWRDDEQLAVGRRVERRLQVLGNGYDVGMRRLGALIPRLEHDKA